MVLAEGITEAVTQDHPAEVSGDPHSVGVLLRLVGVDPLLGAAVLEAAGRPAPGRSPLTFISVHIRAIHQAQRHGTIE